MTVWSSSGRAEGLDEEKRALSVPEGGGPAAVLPQRVEVCRTHTLLMNLEKDWAGLAWTMPFHLWSVPWEGRHQAVRIAIPIFRGGSRETCPLPMSSHPWQSRSGTCGFFISICNPRCPGHSCQGPLPRGSPQCTCIEGQLQSPLLTVIPQSISAAGGAQCSARDRPGFLGKPQHEQRRRGLSTAAQLPAAVKPPLSCRQQV